MKHFLLLTKLGLAIMVASLVIAALALMTVAASAHPYLPNPPLPNGALRSTSAPPVWIYDAQGNLMGAQSPNGVDTFFMPMQMGITTLPSIASGFGTNPSIFASLARGFRITVGTAPGGSGSITMPASPNGWMCKGSDVTNFSTILLQQSADTTTSVSFNAYSMTTGTATNFVAGDELHISCVEY